MVASQVDRNKLIKEYVDNLSREIQIDKIVFFGSGARGKLRENSDLDYIVISNDFKKMGFMKRLQLLSHSRIGLSRKVPMDILGYTQEEFKTMAKQNVSILLSEAKREGQIVYSKKLS